MSYKKQGVPWDTQVKLKRGPSSRELGSSQEPQEFLSLPLPSWHCPVMLQTCCLFMAGRRGPLRFSRVNAMVWLGQIFGERPDFPLFLCKWNQPYSMFSQTCSRTLPMWGAWHSGTSSRTQCLPGQDISFLSHNQTWHPISVTVGSEYDFTIIKVPKYH